MPTIHDPSAVRVEERAREAAEGRDGVCRLGPYILATHLDEISARSRRAAVGLSERMCALEWTYISR